MKYAYVSTNLLDLWSEPRFNSERASQLLFGEIIRLGAMKAGYVRVYQTDNYAGWADRRFLRDIPRTQASTYQKAITHVVVGDRARLGSVKGKVAPSPHSLFYGTKVRLRSTKNGMAVCQLPDGDTYYVRYSNLRPLERASGTPVRGSDIVREARRFLGVPYLWGGISPNGFDCSGLVRAVLGRFGIYVPRDTKDQIKAGTAIPRDDVKTGDLVFFKRHVGFAIGRSRIIHSSVGGSGVRVNSLTPGLPDYRPDLDRDFAAARRIL